MAFQDQAGNARGIESAIKRLWSEDNSVRDLGREEVLRIGRAAAEPLVQQLSELITDNRPRFATEREDEGRKALQQYVALVRRNNELMYDDNAPEAVVRLAINQRLISDTIFLLGELRAVEGVPILIRIMERREPMTSYPLGIELEALRKIGSPALPSLIRSIENARTNASAAMFEEPIAFDVSILIDLRPDTENEEDEEWDAGGDEEGALDPESEWEIEIRTRTIREKALRLLGEIGDESALPFLESLIKRDANRTLAYSILDAIRRIRKEPPVSRPKPQLRRR